MHASRKTIVLTAAIVSVIPRPAQQKPESRRRYLWIPRCAIAHITPAGRIAGYLIGSADWATENAHRQLRY
jgi:hypothetical protein